MFLIGCEKSCSKQLTRVRPIAKVWVMSLRHIPTATNEEIRELLENDVVAEKVRLGMAHDLIQQLANHVLSLRAIPGILNPKLDELETEMREMHNRQIMLEEELSEAKAALRSIYP